MLPQLKKNKSISSTRFCVSNRMLLVLRNIHTSELSETHVPDVKVSAVPSTTSLSLFLLMSKKESKDRIGKTPCSFFMKYNFYKRLTLESMVFCGSQ